MTLQDTQTLIDFCVQQEAANASIRAHMPMSSNTSHFDTASRCFALIAARLAAATEIEAARDQLRAKLTSVSAELRQTTTERDATQTALDNMTARCTELTQRLNALVEDTTHEVVPTIHVLSTPADSKMVIGRRRCQIPDHRRQIRSMQRWIEVLRLQVVEERHARANGERVQVELRDRYIKAERALTLLQEERNAAPAAPWWQRVWSRLHD